MNIDVVIFIAFLVVSLIMGVQYGLGVKNIKQYALGNRNFSTAAIISTIIASVGGNILVMPLHEVYTTGLNYAFACLGVPICIFFTAYFLIPRMQEFLGSISVAEAMGGMFGKKVRVISAISGSISSAGFIAIQFKILSCIFIYFLGINEVYTNIIAASIIIFYSAFGGTRFVAKTDVVQLMTFSVFIPILCIVIWNKLDSWGSIANAASATIFDYKKVFSFENTSILSTLALFFILSIPGLEPYIFQRISIGKDTLQVKKAFIISAIIVAAASILMSWVAFLLFAHNQFLDSSQLLQHIVLNYTSEGFNGVLLVGITAICMSTADSLLNCSSVLIAHDILKPLKLLSKKSELLASRLVTIILGVIAIALSFIEGGFLKIALIGQSFYMPIVTVPMFFSILGFRSNSRSVLIGMLGGFITVMIWHIYDIEINSIIPGMFANAICLFASHYIFKAPMGWVGIKNMNHVNAIRANRRRRFSILMKSMKDFSLLVYLEENLPVNDRLFILFGAFIMTSTYVSMYMMPEYVRAEDYLIYHYLCRSIIVIASIIMIYTVWPPLFKSKKLISILWVPSLFYILAFTSFIMVIISNFNPFHIVVYLLGVLVMSILLRWKSTLVFIIAGAFFANYFIKYIMHIDCLTTSINIQSHVTYLLFMITIIMICFASGKQKAEDANKLLLQKLLLQNLTEKYKRSVFDIEKLKCYKKDFSYRLTYECIDVFNQINEKLQSLDFVTPHKNITINLRNIAKNLSKVSGVLKECLDTTNTLVTINISMIDIDLFIDELYFRTELWNFTNILIEKNTKVKKWVVDKELIYKAIAVLLRCEERDSHITIVIKDSVLEVDADFAANIKQKISSISLEITSNSGFYNLSEKDLEVIRDITKSHCGDFVYISEDSICILQAPVDIEKVIKKLSSSIDSDIEYNNINKEIIKREAIEKLAKNMISQYLEIRLISKVTGLSVLEIENLSVQNGD